MFNLEALNDYEFELLCRDILERKLDKNLYTFARGRDGGIDICDSKTKPEIIGQAKHYIKSTYALLVKSLTKEVKRISERKPQQYFVCTSQRLTRKNKVEIYQMFESCMEGISNIIDAEDIDDFLSEKENRDIVEKHYKLWLCASNVLSMVNNQNVFIDCEELLESIEKNVRFFVETRAYREAMKKLVENHMIIIIGNPGVGKSTLSKMLVLKFVEEGYVIRYSTDNKIENIKNVLSMNPEVKEIILLDDFLGQHYLKMRESQPNEVKSLMAFVKRNKNKKLILNSRITILNEAVQQSLVFKGMMEKREVYTYLINLDKMSYVEKAMILYNHLFFNNVPAEFYTQIRNDYRYRKIVFHKNYSPRIIEYVTKKNVYREVLPENYFSYIMYKLDNPEDVWLDEYRNRISEPDRILLNVMYSLTDTIISRNILEEAFNCRMKIENFPSSINVFADTCVRMNDSMLKNIVEKGMIKTGAVNPSVNDFLRMNLKSNVLEQIRMIETAVYAEQIMKVMQSEGAEDCCKKMVLDGTFLKKKALRNSVYYYYMHMIQKYGIYTEELCDEVRSSFVKMCEKLESEERGEYGELLIRLLDEDFSEYYDFYSILEKPEVLKRQLSPLDYEYLIRVLELLRKKKAFFSNNSVEMSLMLEELIQMKAEEAAFMEIEQELYEIISEEIEDFDEEEVEKYRCGKSKILGLVIADIVQEKMQNEFDEMVEDACRVVNIPTEDYEVNVFNWFDIEGEISNRLGESDYYDLDDWRENDDGKSDGEAIREIFEREY